MATRKAPPKKEPTLRERASAAMDRVSAALSNPRAAAKKATKNANDGYNERQRNRIDSAVDAASEGRPPPRSRSRR